MTDRRWKTLHPGEKMPKPEKINRFEVFSPEDCRYAQDDLKDYLSQAQLYTKNPARVEVAHVLTLAEEGICTKGEALAAAFGISQVTPLEMEQHEEEVTKHDIQALVDKSKEKIEDKKASINVHRALTSYDVVDTGIMHGMKLANDELIMLDNLDLLESIVNYAEKYAALPQVGRTHLQWASPITVGKQFAWYAERFAGEIIEMQKAADNFVGKISGPVGVSSGLGLVVKHPKGHEKLVLKKLGLKPAKAATQIINPENLLHYIDHQKAAVDVLKNFARDTRNLMRPEIGEFRIESKKDQVGSSAMPHKDNPINLENIEGAARIFGGYHYMFDGIRVSDHQRHLSDSSIKRYLGLAENVYLRTIRRTVKVMETLKPNEKRLKANLKKASKYICSEPLQIVLGNYGFQESENVSPHTYVNRLAKRGKAEKKALRDVALADEKLKPYFEMFTDEEKGSILKPESEYLGESESETRRTCKELRVKITEMKNDVLSRNYDDLLDVESYAQVIE